MGIIIVLIIIAILLYGIAIYNKLVRQNNTKNEAFSTMDVFLKKRWDLVPNLVNTVKGYASHEETVLKEIAALRSKSYGLMSEEEKIKANTGLTGMLGKLIAVAENYPELRANENFINLQNQLMKLEEDIANSRKYYNATVKELNNTIDMFPSNIVANMFGFSKSEMFTVDEENERKTPTVDFNTNK